MIFKLLQIAAPVTLMVLCFGLAVAVYRAQEQANQPVPLLTVSERPSWQAPDLPKPSPETPRIMRQDLSAISTRPLFVQSRRMPVPAPAPAKTKAAKPPPPPRPLPSLSNVSLVGVVTKSAERFALVLSENDRQTVRLTEGDDLRGWRVAHIQEECILLTARDATAQLKLYPASPCSSDPLRRPSLARARENSDATPTRPDRRGPRPE